MKTVNPSVNDILNDYFNRNKCSILLKNNEKLHGVFTKQHKPNRKIIGWWFNALPEKQDRLVFHDEILEISRND